MMKTIRREYRSAKMLIEALEERERNMEKEFILKRKIKNPDGSIPERLDDIEEDDVFDQEISKFNDVIAEYGLEKQHNEAVQRVKLAEDELIKNGLLFAPVDVREDLENRSKYNYTVRQKLIGIILKFDFSNISNDF